MCKGDSGPIQNINILYKYEVPFSPTAINLLKGIFGKNEKSKSIVCLICSSQLVIDGTHISVSSKDLEVNKGFIATLGNGTISYAYTSFLSIFVQ